MAEKTIFKMFDAGDVLAKSVIDEANRIIWHPITREVADRYGDIVRIAGGDMTEFNRKPAVLYGHDYAGKNPVTVIGKNIGFRIEGDTYYAGTQFLATDTPDMSQGLKDLINDNWMLHKQHLMGWSIGFMPVDWDEMREGGRVVGYEYKTWKLLEYSSVIIPAHQDAVNDAIKRGIVSKSLTDTAPPVEDDNDEDDDEGSGSREMAQAAINAMSEMVENEILKTVEPKVADKPVGEPEPAIIEPPVKVAEPIKTVKNQNQGEQKIMLKKILEKMAAKEELVQEEIDYLIKLEATPKTDPPVRRLDLVDDKVKVRGMGEIMKLPKRLLNEEEKVLQSHVDEAIMVGTILKKDPRSLKMWDSHLAGSPALRKAMDTATAAEGTEWVPTLVSASYIEDMRLEAKVAGLFQDIPMPSNPYTLPYFAGIGASSFYGKPEATSDNPVESPASTPATGSQTLTAKSFIANIPFSDELSEDSVVPVLPVLRSDLIRGGAEAVDDVIINGDTTATHMDSDVTDSRDRRKLWNGLRDHCQSGNKADHSTFSTAVYLVLLKTMGKYATNPSELAVIGGHTMFHLFRALSEVLTVDKYGPKATILSGEMGSLLGSPIIISDYIRQNLNATYVYDGVTMTKTQYLIVNRRGFMLGSRNQAKLDFQRDPKVGQNYLILNFRKAFQPRWTPSSTITTIAMGYNLS